MARFKRVEFEVHPTYSCGQYLITAVYKGKEIRVITEDAEVFDWHNDDSDRERHLEAKRYCYRKIVEKYNGNFPYYEKSQQNYNVIIKKICRQVGITDKVLWERTVGGKVVRKTFKRYELVSSHTARRSFATNAYLAGIPTARIMLITGHKTEDSFFKYIRISRSENAKLLADHPFFN